MILDDNNNKLYICDFKEIIKLNKIETKLLYFFIINKEKKNTLLDIMNYLYGTNENFNSYFYIIRNIIYKLNLKLKDYNIRIAARNKVGYYIDQKESVNFLLFKKQFFNTHTEERLLLDLYSKRDEATKFLEELEKNIETLEKKII